MAEDFLTKCLQLKDTCADLFDLPTDKDWQRVQEQIGFTFPDSHKEFVNAFGSGYFGDFEFWNPAGKGGFELSAARLLDTHDSCEALKDMDCIFSQMLAGLFLSVGRLRLDYSH